jgi:hypothetical protein
MERKERIIRLLSQPPQGKSVEEEGIGWLSSDGRHYLSTIYFIKMRSTTMILKLSARTLIKYLSSVYVFII